MKKDSEIICVIKDPGERPIVASIPNTLEALQKAVDGHIEAVTIASDLALICNEEGLIRWRPYNLTICERTFVGPIVAVGVDGKEFVSLTPNQIQSIRRLLSESESDFREGGLG